MGQVITAQFHPKTELEWAGGLNDVRISQSSDLGRASCVPTGLTGTTATASCNGAIINTLIVSHIQFMFDNRWQTLSGQNPRLAFALDSVAIPGEARAFCSRRQLDYDLRRTLGLADKNFSIIGQPTFRIIEDAECDENYIAIHVNVKGTVEEVFQQSETFLDEFVTSIDGSKRRFINLVYHAI